MIDALCHGKLSREQENLEDLLTSMVFGCLRHTPPAEGVLPWLRMARTLPLGSTKEPTLPLRDLRTALNIRYQFWPAWKESDCNFCEPDLALYLDLPEGEKWLVCIEAKYWSGKSSGSDPVSEIPTDQLARELDNLVRIAVREGRRPLLVYLTTGFGIPAAEIQESLAEYKAKRGHDATKMIAWLSWRQLPALFATSESSLLAELPRLCARLDLTDYSGIAPVKCDFEMNWAFRAAPRVAFDWNITLPGTCRWEFCR